MKSNKLVQPIFLILMLLVVGMLPVLVFAQAAPEQTDPIRLYLSNLEYDLDFPEVVADVYGRVHVATAVNDLELTEAASNGAIFYTVWDGGAWSNPVDILAGTNAGYVSLEKFAITDKQQLHLLWLETTGSLNWSRLQANEAASARSWHTIDLVNDATNGDIALRDEQDVAVAYVLKNRDIIFRRTLDGGDSWTQDVTVWQPPNGRLASRDVRLALDDDGVYHLAWTEADTTLDWNPSAVWYARSIDGGATWQDFYYVPDEGSYINIGFDGEGNVHLLWNQNVSRDDGRYHTWSRDGGQTWEKPQVTFHELSGRTGFPRMILDDDGILHQISSGRGRGRNGGIYASYWTGTRWAEPQLLSADVQDDNNEGPSAALALGNQMHIVWRNNNTLGDVIYSNVTTNGTQLEPVPLPETLAFVTPEQEATAVPTAQIEATAVPTKLPISLAQAPPNSGISTTYSVIGAIGIAFLLVMVVVMIQWMRINVR